MSSTHAVGNKLYGLGPRRTNHLYYLHPHASTYSYRGESHSILYFNSISHRRMARMQCAVRSTSFVILSERSGCEAVVTIARPHARCFIIQWEAAVRYDGSSLGWRIYWLGVVAVRRQRFYVLAITARVYCAFRSITDLYHGLPIFCVVTRSARARIYILCIKSVYAPPNKAVSVASPLAVCI